MTPRLAGRRQGFSWHSSVSRARLALVALASVALALPRLASALGPQPGEWLMPRHNVRQTAYAPEYANLAQPAVRWRIPIPSQLAAATAVDVDLDGHQDLLTVNAGRLAASTLLGKILWQTASLGINSVVGLADVDSDGTPEVVAAAAHAVHVLRLASGEILWSSPPGAYKSLGLAALADFTGDGKVDVAIASSSGFAAQEKPAAAIWSFAEATATVVATTAMPGPDNLFPYGTHHQVVDVDGDEVVDLLVPGVKRLGAFSGKTGELLAITPVLEKLFVFLPVQRWRPKASQEAPWVVWPASNPGGGGALWQVGWYVLQKQGKELAVRWQYQAADPASEAVVVVSGSGGDLDGDGQGELIASRFSGGQWRLQAWDLPTGQTLTTSTGADFAAGTGQPGELGPVLAGAFRHAGEAFLVVQLQVDRTAPQQPPLRLVSWSRKGGFVQLADLGEGRWWPGNRPALNDGLAGWTTPLVPLLSMQTGQESPELIMLRDKDKDGAMDHLERLLWTAGGLQLLKGQALPANALPIQVVSAAGGLRLVLAGADGQVAAWDHQLQLVNDANGDGKADLVRFAAGQAYPLVGRWKATDASPSLVMAVGAQVAAYSLAAAGPGKAPAETWRRFYPATVQTLNLLDSDGDGTREAIAGLQPVGQTVQLRAISSAGEALFQWSPPPPLMAWNFAAPGLMAHDVDADGAEDLLVRMTTQLPGPDTVVRTSQWSGKTHTLLWTGACRSLTEAHVSLDLSTQPPRAVAAPFMSRYSCDALTGQLLAESHNQTGGYGVPMVAELNGAAPAEFVLGGPALVMQALDGQTLAQLWTVDDKRVGSSAAAVVDTLGKPVSVQLAGPAAEVQVRDAATGKLLWARVLLAKQAWPVELAPPHTVSVQRLAVMGGLSGPGDPVAIVSSSEGLLYALKVSDGSVLWTLETFGAVSTLVPADVDGDGALELLVAMPTGELVALDGNVATAPAAVLDVEATGANPPAVDIDMQEETTVIAARWTPVANAQGYVARLVDDNGAQLVPATAANEPVVRVQDLYLQPGRTYRWAVASHASQGADASFSSEAWSDGVAIVDASPPWFSDLPCQPACAVLPGTAVGITGHAYDRTRLAHVRAELRDNASSSAAPLSAVQWPWLGTDYPIQWQSELPGPGSYNVQFTATDLAGHSAKTTVTLHVCATGQVVKGSVCGLADTPGPKPVVVDGTEAEGCSGGSAGRGLGALIGLLAVGVVAVLGRRRTGRKGSPNPLSALV